MFDLTSSKLLLLAVVALLVIGPKDFPSLLRAIGKYVGIIRGHAKEFRAQFDEAMRDSELGQIKKDMEKFGRETEETLAATKQSVEQTVADARQGVEGSVQAPTNGSGLPSPASTADPLPAPPAEVAVPTEGGESQPPVTPAPATVASTAPQSPPGETTSSQTTEASQAAAAPKTTAASAVERTV